MYSAWVALAAAGTKDAFDLQHFFFFFSDFRRCFDTESLFNQLHDTPIGIRL
jgi:hypothetical protein